MMIHREVSGVTVLVAELVRVKRTRLAQACLELDAAAERTLAEEGLASDAAAWPAY